MNSHQEQKGQYDHYIAVDWAKSNMAIARMTMKSNKVIVIEQPSDVLELKTYLSQLKGSKALTIEETTTTQWLYTQLGEDVDRLIVCDPYRNRLLCEGAKTDKIDAIKLVQLLRGGLLKEVYHSWDERIYLRKIVSGYEDLVKSGVRLKNQRKSLISAAGKHARRGIKLDNFEEQFVLRKLEDQIVHYEETKKSYEQEFARIGKKIKAIRLQRSLPGIGTINAVKIVARVVEPRRFASKGDYLSYCGLIKLDRVSGGRSYGKRNPRHCPCLKSVYKTAALAATKSSGNPLKSYYHHLMNEKNYPDYQARHAVARRIAVLSYGILKGGEPYRGE